MPSWNPAWPDFEGEGYNEGIAAGFLRSPMTYGPAKRRLIHHGSDTLAARVLFEKDEYAEFVDWFINDLKRGALSFTKVNSRTGLTNTYAFTDSDVIGASAVAAGLYYDVPMNLEVLG